MKYNKSSVYITERLISIIAPHYCLSCKNVGQLLCEWCKEEAILPVPSRCYKCNVQTTNFAVCPTHRRNSPLRHVFVVSEYDGLTKQLIHKLKFERANMAAEVIAGLINDNLPRFDKDILITHLPTANYRVRQRGYDQAELIARKFSKMRDLHYHRTLARIGSTRQVGAKRNDRINQAKDSYRALLSLPKGTSVLLVDDIVTTGASIESAAKVLKKAGAKEVNALVFARVA